MNLKEKNKLIALAKANKKVLVFNFQGKELDYADPNWIVINEWKGKRSCFAYAQSKAAIE